MTAVVDRYAYVGGALVAWPGERPELRTDRQLRIWFDDYVRVANATEYLSWAAPCEPIE